MRMSVVVPVYKCGATLPELVERLGAVLAPLADDYEIVLVNDACPDDSWLVIEQLAASNNKVTGIPLPANRGQAGAIAVGVTQAVGDYVVVMDGDLQDAPERIPDFYQSARQHGWDVVFGERIQRNHSWFRSGLSHVYRLLAPLLGMPKVHRYGSYTLLSRSAVNEYLQQPERHHLFVTSLTWISLPRGAVAYEQVERAQGTSAYTLSSLLRLFNMRVFLRRLPRFMWTVSILLTAVIYGLSALFEAPLSIPGCLFTLLLLRALLEVYGRWVRKRFPAPPPWVPEGGH